jgi:hypothetical protein
MSVNDPRVRLLLDRCDIETVAGAYALAGLRGSFG